MLKEKLILGNWKMNGREETVHSFLAQIISLSCPIQTQVGIAFPSVYLSIAKQITQNSEITIGAQNLSQFSQDGAYTGEVSALMLKDLHLNFTLIGHSERRQYFNESNQQITDKLNNAYQNNLLPILCVGENLEARESNVENRIISEQLSVLDNLIQNDRPIIIAYEPIWAIGTGKVASVEQIEKMHQYVYEQLLSKGANPANIRILYGGSVNAENASTIFSLPKVSGALIGGASLKVEDFTKIIKATEN